MSRSPDDNDQSARVLVAALDMMGCKSVGYRDLMPLSPAPKETDRMNESATNQGDAAPDDPLPAGMKEALTAAGHIHQIALALGGISLKDLDAAPMPLDFTCPVSEGSTFQAAHLYRQHVTRTGPAAGGGPAPRTARDDRLDMLEAVLPWPDDVPLLRSSPEANGPFQDYVRENHPDWLCASYNQVGLTPHRLSLLWLAAYTRGQAGLAREAAASFKAWLRIHYPDTPTNSPLALGFSLEGLQGVWLTAWQRTCRP